MRRGGGRQKEGGKKVEKTQTTEIIDQREDITNNLRGKQNILRKQYEQSYANKLENLTELDKFLEK